MNKVKTIISNEYFHRDFQLFVNRLFENSIKKPIILKGEFESGKKTMVRQLGNLLGIEPKIFDFSLSTVNDEVYFDQKLLLEDLKKSEKRGDFIVIKNFDEVGIYDSFLLVTFFADILNKKNQKSTIIILENNPNQNFRHLTDVIRRSCYTINVGKDPVIEEKIRKAKEEQAAKQKKMKGVM